MSFSLCSVQCVVENILTKDVTIMLYKYNKYEWGLGTFRIEQRYQATVY